MLGVLPGGTSLPGSLPKEAGAACLQPLVQAVVHEQAADPTQQVAGPAETLIGNRKPHWTPSEALRKTCNVAEMGWNCPGLPSLPATHLTPTQLLHPAPLLNRNCCHRG